MAGRILTPLVSINIPCYRQLEYARQCLDAIRAQTFHDFEVTLYDDGESDHVSGGEPCEHGRYSIRSG